MRRLRAASLGGLLEDSALREARRIEVAPHDVEYNAKKGAQRIVSIFFTHARTLAHGRCGREPSTCTCKASTRFNAEEARRADGGGVGGGAGGAQ